MAITYHRRKLINNVVKCGKKWENLSIFGFINFQLTTNCAQSNRDIRV